MLLVDGKKRLQLELGQEFSNEALLLELVVCHVLSSDPSPANFKVCLQATVRGLQLACKKVQPMGSLLAQGAQLSVKKDEL